MFLKPVVSYLPDKVSNPLATWRMSRGGDHVAGMPAATTPALEGGFII